MSPGERTKKRRPTKAMVKEIKEVFERHNWSGAIVPLPTPDSIGLAADSTGVAARAASGLAPTPDSLNCIPPAKPTFDCQTLPNGTIVCGWVCR
jgi:hypothetical protein